MIKQNKKHCHKDFCDSLNSRESLSRGEKHLTQKPYK